MPIGHGTLKIDSKIEGLYWKLPSELALGERTLIMGVLNVTPDSFSDGGMVPAIPTAPIARALELEEQGADIIDIGAESTRPGILADLSGRRMAASRPGAQAP